MPDLSVLIREYCEILGHEQALSERKEQLRRLILEEMQTQKLAETRAALGTAQRTTRFKLHPRREEVLGLLSGEDLFPFASFPSQKVKTILVPKYGRERLLPLFDIEKIESLLIKRQRGASGGAGPHAAKSERPAALSQDELDE